MYKYFKPEELKCKCNNCGSTGREMDNDFMQKLDTLREYLGFPFVITSAYRCPAHNNNVSSTGFNGAHTTGKAVDIAVNRTQAYDLMKAAFEQGFTGIGVNQKSVSRYIHIDTITASPSVIRPTVWSY